MNKLILLCFIFTFANNVFSQKTIVGEVNQSNGAPIEYFTVRFMSDTTSIATGSFVGGKFSAVVPTNVNKVEVSAWSFNSDCKSVRAQDDTLQFSLVNHQHQLGEVDVIASKKHLTIDGSNFILAVEGTSLAEMANINDVLCRIPLLMVNENNGISMFGKNNIVVYVNNRRITNKKEVENINPQAIRDVKLVGSPGARYDADADAVISITTKDYNGTEVVVRNTATKGRLFSDDTNAMLNVRQGNTTIHADYTLTASKNKSYEGSTIDNTENQQEYNDDVDTEGKIIGHAYSIAGEHTFNNEHRFSVQFAGWNDRSQTEVEAGQQYYYTLYDLSSVATHKTTTGIEDHYDIGAGYDLKFSQQSGMSVVANYTIHRTEANSSILENIQLHDYDFDSKYNAIDAQVDYDTSTDNGFGLSAGCKVSAVSNESESAFNSSSVVLESAFSYDYDFKEKIIGAYLDLNKNIGGVEINAGVRVEHTDFEGNHNKRNVIDTAYFTFVPNLKLTYATSSKNKFSLAYRNTINRPTFNSLSPSIRYDNAFYYRKGNPALLPTITSNVVFAWNMGSKFWMNFGYRHKRNATIYQYTKTDNDNAIEVILSNHKHVHFILASIGYSFNKGRLRSTNSVSVTKPFAQIRLYNGEYKIDRCAYYFKTTNDFTINKHFGVNADFIFNDQGETLLEKKDAMYNLSVGATAFFFENSLAFSLVANDILDTYTFKDHREFGSYKVDHKYNPDNTYVRLTVRYLFRSGKTKRLQTIESNSQTVNRM